MKLLVNCDQVFDILTRGPFPTGDESDAAVEHHLRACHECRQLAEALRPAISLLHEAVASDEALELPEYQGSLPRLEEPAAPPAALIAVRRLSLGMRQLSAPRRSRSASPRAAAIWNASRLIAASVLLVALGTLGYGLAIAPVAKSDMAAGPPHPAISLGALRMPRQNDPLLTLASLRLPGQCFPEEYRSLSPVQASHLVKDIARGSEHSLHCCTDCHKWEVPQPGAAHSAQTMRILAVAYNNCAACHRG